MPGVLPCCLSQAGAEQLQRSRSPSNALHVRHQRVACEILLPQPGPELDHPAYQVLTDVLQHIDQIPIQVDLIPPASDQKALEHLHVVRTQLGPVEQPILAPQRGGSQGPLQEVGIDRYVPDYSDRT